MLKVNKNVYSTYSYFIKSFLQSLHCVGILQIHYKILEFSKENNIKFVEKIIVIPQTPKHKLPLAVIDLGDVALQVFSRTPSVCLNKFLVERVCK